MEIDWSQVAVRRGGEEQPRTLSDVVTHQLREAIIRGKLRPGQPLWQDRLAEEFSVSRVPIRESLRQLAAEGLVTLKSHRSAVVTELSQDEIDEIYAMMTSLEMLAARRGVRRLSEEDLARMQGLLDRMMAVTDEPIDWYMASAEFHRILIAASGWMRLVRTVDLCRKNVMRYVNSRPLYFSQLEAWNRRNADLLEACKARDTDRVLAIIENMGVKASQAVIDYLQKIA